ncbi:hypothetical protein SCALM49S_03370 [Streptomyces californicus]
MVRLALSAARRCRARARPLHVGRTGEVLDQAAVTELHATLSAWLHFTKDEERSNRQSGGPVPPRRSTLAPGTAAD